MNKDLKDKVFDLPDKILKHLDKVLKKMSHVNDKGSKRIRTLLQDKSVTYHQIKRIVHDFKKLEKGTDAYELNGGDIFKEWVIKTLDDARKDIRSHKNSKQRAAEITPGLKNAHIKTHEKEPTVKLNENINRIKELFK